MSDDTHGNTKAKREKILQDFADRGYTARYVGASATMGGADMYLLRRR
jgi:hypothetical protein